MLSWPQRIERAGESGTTRSWFSSRTVQRGFTEEDNILAEDWMTCPTGQVDRRIPRDWELSNESHDDGTIAGVGSPLDPELIALGYKFYRSVCANHVARAAIIYGKIQARAAELVATYPTEEPSDMFEPVSESQEALHE